jgi:subtilisin-like proprotein convertase family protein
MLAPPAGAPVMLMSDVSGTGPGVSGVTYTFDDAGPPLPVGSNAPSGTFHPTDDNSAGADAFPAPAPSGPYNATFALLAGHDPNGTWSLYVYDDAGGDVGSVAAGWKLTLQTRVAGYSICNSNGITIPAGPPGTTAGPASPYPSVINVAFALPNLDESKVRVGLVGVIHSYPRDLDLLLVGPQGHRSLLMSDAAGAGPGFNNVDLFFDNDAFLGLSDVITPGPGTYRPTDYEQGESLPGPAPSGPYETGLSAFKGTDPNGNWSLYVSDDASGDTGSIFGWCLYFDPSIDADDVPNLRFASKTRLTWSPTPNAVEYHLYRGANSHLAALADHNPDSCLTVFAWGHEYSPVTDDPEGGSFYWYLVRGSNAQGEGPAGFMRFRSQVLARIVDIGACP